MDNTIKILQDQIKILKARNARLSRLIQACRDTFGDTQIDTIFTKLMREEVINTSTSCCHEWKWETDYNNESYGTCKHCNITNDEKRTPERTI